MDLQSLQTKLKTAIQNHQIIVLKMKKDPENISLQKSLHELQAEIIALSEKQKNVVQQLRKDIEQKQCHKTYIQRLNHQQKTINNSNQVVIEFSTSNNNCRIVNSTTSPIRVPQYHPAYTSHVVQKTKVNNNNYNNNNSNLENKLVIQEKKSPKLFSASSKLEKSDFMAALGLITKRALDELQSKRMERKRRTTANPNFSSSHIGDRKKTLVVPTTNGPVLKRPRGRPRLVSSDSHDSMNSSVLNGHIKNAEEKDNKSSRLSDVVCSKCGKDGELISCDTCSNVFHLICVNLRTVPSSSWLCPKCCGKSNNDIEYLKKETTQWTNSLAVVHNLIALKSAKSEEKQKLVKRSLELKTEKAQLEDRVKQLTDILASQIEKHKSLMKSNQKILESVNSLKEFIKYLKKT